MKTQRRRVAPPSSTSSSQVPRLSLSTSEWSSASSYGYSPDDSIFKGAEILRSELYSPKSDLWSLSESQHSFDDDDWSDPWSIAERRDKSPSPVRGAKSAKASYRPPAKTLESPGAAVVSSPDSSDVSPPTRRNPRHRRKQQHKAKSIDKRRDKRRSTKSCEQSVSSQDRSLFSGLESVSSSPPPPPPRRRTRATQQDISIISTDSEPPPPPARPPPEASSDLDDSEFGSLLTPRSDDTPTTTMGRDSSLRFKTVTYLVESSLDELTVDDYENDDTVFDDSGDQDDYDDIGGTQDDASGYVPSKYQDQSMGSLRSILSSSSYTSDYLKDYARLRKDPAYMHAQTAGVLWQTLVGQHVRFPRTWWNGARGPPMGLEDASGKYWQYIARHRVFDNDALKSHVRTRSSCGRLLLHLVVRDLMTFVPLEDIVIGCLHPNARGIRKTPEANKKDEGCREVWMAIRKRPAALEKGAAPSLIDTLLTRGRDVEEIANDSPLGNKRKVNNTNMRAVFGEKPPLQTVLVDESELYERMTTAEEIDSFAAPALVLLQEFI